MIVVLDSGVLASIANPQPHSQIVKAMQQWGVQMLAAGHQFAIPAIAVYETRRELLRSGMTASVAALDAICRTRPNIYLPITYSSLLRASDLWARVRKAGQPTSKDDALDGDVILCAQVLDEG